ncbi:hypothetical protein HPB49_014300 [Dermacentor silvarum]|uniref:Uncharacterized protein n=1 Tax=Dermacentor silvarum TaxID=543639 RepID=A0ACB8D618_DERSI|nr:hypothetical protein HPB49_014300 [Dermacentor silvarum]
MAAPPGPRVSAAQTTLLLEFMEQHPYLARGATSLSPSMSAAHKKALWNELTAALNALGPAVNTARRWRQYWARIVHDLKKLAAQVGSEKRKTGGGRLGELEGRVMDVLSRTGPGYAPVDFFADDAEQASSNEEESAAAHVPLPTAPPQVSVGTEPGTSGTARPPTRQQPQRPPRQQQPLEDAAFRAAEECARQRQLAEAANVEAVAFHQMLLEQNRQRASRLVQQQLVMETRGLREATALVAATLRQLVAALARGLREPPQP